MTKNNSKEGDTVTIRDYMKDHLLFLDGATGTMLQKAGLARGERPETRNLTHPDLIRSVAAAYFDAGSNVVCANTFGANRLKFGSDPEEVIAAGLRLAAEARAQSSAPQEKFIALDVGPTGRLLEPYGDLDFDEAVEAFAEVARLGEKHGADLIYIETMTDCYETKAALLGAKEGCDLPIFVSNAYGSDERLLTGTTPEAMVALLEGMGADAVGANCSFGPQQLQNVVRRLLSVASVPVLFKPNAGLPRREGNATVYDITPQQFAQGVVSMMKEGVRIAGGCCGTTPEHLSSLTAAAAGLYPLPVEGKGRCVIASPSRVVSFDGDPVIIGDGINPKAKEDLRQALQEEDLDSLLDEGLDQRDAGAHVLNVNAEVPDSDEPSLLTQAVCHLQSMVHLPLQIHTSDPIALESALRHNNGKALIRALDGTEASMNAVFPLMKRYGAVAVARTEAESGIPATAEERVALALRILKRGEESGVFKHDLLFDPLADAVGLEAVRRLSELGCKTFWDLSDLPQGEAPAATLTRALEQGLSAAQFDPNDSELMNACDSFVRRG